MTDFPPIDPHRNHATLFAFPGRSMLSALETYRKLSEDPEVARAHMVPDLAEDGSLLQWSLEFETIEGVDALAKSNYYWLEMM